MLSAYRVIDLTDHRGQLGGYILRALGAEVILVEPPGGSPARAVGPFAGDEPGPERSLTYWAHNRGKKSVVLDLDEAGGRRRFLDLVATADVLIENEPPGALAARGLGPDDLAAVNPGLVHVSITPFGGTGPKAHWAASDLTLQAASGSLAVTGDADRAPVQVGPSPQAWLHAAAEGAQAALVALYERDQHSGLGQRADVSVQAAMNQAAGAQMLNAALDASLTRRMAGGIVYGGIDVQLMWPCADGFVSVTFLFGVAIGPFSARLMQWVYDEGGCDEATRDKDWIDYGTMLLDGREPVAEYERVRDQVLAPFFAARTKAQLLAAAVERRLLIAPVATVDDVLASPQLEARSYWEQVDLGPLGTVTFPGPIARFSATPLEPLLRPPRLGEHTDEVLAGVPSEPAEPTAEPAAAPSSAAGGARTGPRVGAAMAGLKVLDLMWVMAGPVASRVLADHGADVIKIESVHKLDTARTLAPFVGNEGHPELSGAFHNFNANKRSVSLNLTDPASHPVLFDLVRWADVVLDSYSPRGMESLGLSHQQLFDVKPNLVVASSNLGGQSGPLSRLAGFGTMSAAMSGFFAITGWPDRAPCGPFGAYTDYVSPRYYLCSILAAVLHQRRTGQGQYVDFSQAESSIHNLTPLLLDYAVNGRVADRMGNDDPRFAPHGVYPSTGDDCWVAVACETDDQWRALCGVLGGAAAGLAGLTVEERLDRRRELDGLISTWTAERTAGEATEALQAAGVPAHGAAISPDAVADPQLRHRGHFAQAPHGKLGQAWVETSRFQLSRTPAELWRAAPLLGEDTFEVLSGVLGYDDDRIADLAAQGFLE